MTLTKLKHTLLLLYFGLFVTLLSAQEAIHLHNPSFEDLPNSNAADTWTNCGDSFEQKPDIQPNGGLGVMKAAWEGLTYISLVTRDNNTVQAIGQRLSATLEADRCYDFALILAQSERYVSRSRRTQTTANYTQAIKLRIWGGNASCEKTELLSETALVTHSDWKDYVFQLQPQEDLNYIILEAYYDEPNLFPYNGHVLIDDASPILQVPCNSSEAAAWEELYQDNLSDIALDNGSFEETINDETAIRFWKTCDADQDLMTIEPAASLHQMPVPQDGINYVALKIDDNTLKGAISKGLKPPLQARQCYRLSFWAARNDVLLGASPYLKKQVTNFDGWAKIKIWGVQKACGTGDVLAETPIIRHQDWKKYEFIIQPDQYYSHLKIEAAYEHPIQFFYNGHVLIDDLSDFELLNCDSLEYYYETLQFPVPESIASSNSKPAKQNWLENVEKPKGKMYKSFTYSVRDSDASINENIETLLHQAYPDYLLLFNIFGPTKEDAAFQEDLLLRELKRLKYPSNWYKTKIYLED